jgi:hypothetical protein
MQARPPLNTNGEAYNTLPVIKSTRQSNSDETDISPPEKQLKQFPFAHSLHGFQVLPLRFNGPMVDLF